MSRVPRIQVKDALNFVLIQGDNYRPIFKDDDDYASYAELLAKYRVQHAFQLYAFCLTPSSVSLLIEPSSSATISQIMHDANSRYTKYFNKKYGRSGHLFQERHRMVLVEKAPNLLRMSAYIHLMPKLSGLTDDIGAYRHSSYLTYIKEDGSGAELGAAWKEIPDITLEAKEALAYLNGGSYRQYVSEMALDEAGRLDRELRKKTVIGSDEFGRKVRLKIEQEKKKPVETFQPEPKPDIQPAPEPEPQPTLPEPQGQPRPEPEPSPKPGPNVLIFIIPAILTALIIAAMGLFVYTKITQMGESLRQEMARKDLELQERLAREKRAFRDELSAKYEEERIAEKASFMAMSKRLEEDKMRLEEDKMRLEQDKLRLEEELSKAKLSMLEKGE